jgi:hypothetical protein
VEIMGGKFFHKLEVFLLWMLLNRNFLKENRYYPHAGWENFCAKIFPKLLLGQCRGNSNKKSPLQPWQLYQQQPQHQQQLCRP